MSLAGLLVARLLTGVALGAAVATATAYIADLDAGPDGSPTRRSGIVATVANIGGLALGPLLAGVLAQYAPAGLTLPYVVLLTALLVATVAVAGSPRRAHTRSSPAPAIARSARVDRRRRAASSSQRPPARSCVRRRAGCSPAWPAFLAGPLHHPSAALTGLAIFLNFGAGVLVQTTTTRWSASS